MGVVVRRMVCGVNFTLKYLPEGTRAEFLPYNNKWRPPIRETSTYIYYIMCSSSCAQAKLLITIYYILTASRALLLHQCKVVDKHI